MPKVVLSMDWFRSFSNSSISDREMSDMESLKTYEGRYV